MMKLIVISNPTSLVNEKDLIQQLFESGLETFHLRKPEMSSDEFEHFLKEIKPQFLRRIVIHAHHQLINRYNLKGIHLTGRLLEEMDKLELKQLVKKIRTRGLTVSASLHSLEEITALPVSLDYVFLSPVYHSISKAGYPAGFELPDLKRFFQKTEIKTPVIALGGVSAEKIMELREIGFSGTALLGSIWQAENPLINWQKSLENTQNSAV
ncbi:thiamine-phosphate pyrophosphorylase [Pseudarcicella hirudinis]|uniref:Thiamine-phosphate pyrophosphorylase n=2 Tax=Pseudarcicella hirudinis TaxID=1079859 RepID=A0A1I5MBI8_9BACT|nr:thiamine-phosphate pyrophosphorylase [Pseudarcicella hirudinis]